MRNGAVLVRVYRGKCEMLAGMSGVRREVMRAKYSKEASSFLVSLFNSPSLSSDLYVRSMFFRSAVSGMAEECAQADEESTASSDAELACLLMITRLHDIAVDAAQSIIADVPKSNQFKVESTIDNQDIGFISVRQPAEVKVEGFPHTRYGLLHGTVVQVSNDAKQDDTDKKSLVFTTQFALPSDTMLIDGSQIHLAIDGGGASSNY